MLRQLSVDLYWWNCSFILTDTTVLNPILHDLHCSFDKAILPTGTYGWVSVTNAHWFTRLINPNDRDRSSLFVTEEDCWGLIYARLKKDCTGLNDKTMLSIICIWNSPLDSKKTLDASVSTLLVAEVAVWQVGTRSHILWIFGRWLSIDGRFIAIHGDHQTKEKIIKHEIIMP